jgi:hypothetical protein
MALAMIAPTDVKNTCQREQSKSDCGWEILKFPNAMLKAQNAWRGDLSLAGANGGS